MAKRFITFKELLGDRWIDGGVIDLAEVVSIGPSQNGLRGYLDGVHVIYRSGLDFAIPLQGSDADKFANGLTKAFMGYVSQPEPTPKPNTSIREERLALFNKGVKAEISKSDAYGRISAFYLSISETTEWDTEKLNGLDEILKYPKGTWQNTYFKIMECYDAI